MVRGANLAGIDLIGLMPLLLVLLAIVVPMLLGRRRLPPDQPGEDADADGGGGGGGSGPPPAPRAPRAPFGGLPLPRSAPARVRLRDHVRLAERLPPRQRRPSREPARVPVGPRAPVGLRRPAQPILKRYAAGRDRVPFAASARTYST